MSKLYRVLLDEAAQREKHLRVIDESGEDYLYPAEFFVMMDLSRGEDRALLFASG